METLGEKSNPAWRQKATGQNTTWRQRKTLQKISPQQVESGKREINAQVVRRHSPQR